MLFVFEEVPATAVEPARKQPVPTEPVWERQPAISLANLSFAAARVSSRHMDIVSIYGERDFGYLIQRTFIRDKFRYLYYSLDSKRPVKGPFRETELGALDSALIDCTNRGRSHWDTEWAASLRLLCNGPTEEIILEEEEEEPLPRIGSGIYYNPNGIFGIRGDGFLEPDEDLLAGEEVFEDDEDLDDDSDGAFLTDEEFEELLDDFDAEGLEDLAGSYSTDTARGRYRSDARRAARQAEEKLRRARETNYRVAPKVRVEPKAYRGYYYDEELDECIWEGDL